MNRPTIIPLASICLFCFKLFSWQFVFAGYGSTETEKILLIMILCTLAICSSSFSFLLHLEISTQTKLMTWNNLFIIFITRNDTKYRYYRPILFSRNIKSNIMNTSQIFSYLTNIANMLQIQTHTLIFCSRNNEVFSGNYQTLNYKMFLIYVPTH